LSSSNIQGKRKLFVSNKTYKERAKNSILMMEPERSDLEVVLSFEHFREAKTSENIAAWLHKSHLRGGLKPDYILCHATDGASNAVGSAAGYKAITESLRETEIEHYTCFAHQVNRSAKFASGTGDFKDNANEELSAVIQKLHEINGRIYRNEGRLQVLYGVQNERGR
jgi:hypothetical protein